MNAIEFLIYEHDKMRKKLSEINNNSHNFETRRKMFDGLCQDLMIHERVEEEKWYPHFKNKLSSRVKHLINEEQHVAKEINNFSAIHDEKVWHDKYVKFKKAVEHHADEEEIKLFSEVNKLLTETQLDEIGKELREYKIQLSEGK